MRYQGNLRITQYIKHIPRIISHFFERKLQIHIGKDWKGCRIFHGEESGQKPIWKTNPAKTWL